MSELEREIRRMSDEAGCPVNVRFAKADDLVSRDMFVVRLEHPHCSLTGAAAASETLAGAFASAIAMRDRALNVREAA